MLLQVKSSTSLSRLFFTCLISEKIEQWKRAGPLSCCPLYSHEFEPHRRHFYKVFFHFQFLGGCVFHVLFYNYLCVVFFVFVYDFVVVVVVVVLYFWLCCNWFFVVVDIFFIFFKFQSQLTK